MSISQYIKEIGRGAAGARSLDRTQSQDLMAQVLDGQVTDLEIGAFALAMRVKGESVDGLIGFADAMQARTLMIERLPGVAADVIEAQLAHGKSGPLGMAYDRAEFMEQRRALMCMWADYLDQLRAGAKVFAFKAA